MKAKETFIFCVSFIAICILSSFLPIHNEDEIYDKVIRLHIIAASDSEYDQDLKLRVRDEILKSDVFGTAENMSDAEQIIEGSEAQLLEIAKGAVEKYGNGETVEVKWGYERYPTRLYENTVYPAGKYRSLRIIIGEGEGQNWWCVLFPPLCTESGVAELPLDKEAKNTFTLGGKKKYTIRLKILEWFSFYD